MESEKARGEREEREKQRKDGRVVMRYGQKRGALYVREGGEKGRRAVIDLPIVSRFPSAELKRRSNLLLDVSKREFLERLGVGLSPARGRSKVHQLSGHSGVCASTLKRRTDLMVVKAEHLSSR